MITMLNSIANSWLDYFSYAVVQNTAFLAIIFLLLHLFRNADARFNYALSILGIFKLLIPPFLPGSFESSPAIIGTAVFTADISILPAQPGTPQLSFFALLFLVWSATIFLYSFSSLFSTLKLKKQLGNTSFIRKVSMDNHLIALYKSSNISVPMSLGIRSKRIYVPKLWDSLTEAQQNALVRHELAHIQRWDGLAHILQIVAQAIYFFHPLVWLLNERINEYREMACDELAVERANVTPLAYSRTLVHVAERSLPIWSTSSASALIKQRHKLYHRVNYLIKETHNMKANNKKRTWLVLSMVVLLMAPLSWYCSKESPDTIEQSNVLSNPVSATKEMSSQAAEFDTTPQPVGGFAAIQSNLVYPEAARKAGVEGRVTVQVRINEKGQVTESKVVKSLGDTGCDEAAIAALKAVQWKPALKDGQPVAVEVALPIVFKLQ